VPEWLILADDLTGANDSGAAFARRGLETIVALSPGPLPPAEVWVLSSASRALPPEQAAQVVRVLLRAALRSLPAEPAPRLYKKIDSALRGNPAEELLAVLQVAGAERALLAPAFPAQGRTVRGGRVTWQGLPLRQTEFRDQIRTDDLYELFHSLEATVPLRSLALETIRRGAEACAAELARGPGLWIADAESDADLDILAAAAHAVSIPVLCGSAGLANALARAAAEGPLSAAVPGPAGGETRPALLVAGSRSRVTASQIEAALQAGARMLPDDYLHSGAPSDLEALIEDALQSGEAPWILTLQDVDDDPAHPDRLLERLGAAAAEMARRAKPAGLVLTGGDTAAAVCNALHARLMRLHGEIEPGIAWGRLLDGDVPGLAVVTKAGSFGERESLARVLAFLS
jgi:uncharacterized protein YgbK (DUF1537 family)